MGIEAESCPDLGKNSHFGSVNWGLSLEANVEDILLLDGAEEEEIGSHQMEAEKAVPWTRDWNIQRNLREIMAIAEQVRIETNTILLLIVT